MYACVLVINILTLACQRERNSQNHDIAQTDNKWRTEVGAGVQEKRKGGIIKCFDEFLQRTKSSPRDWGEGKSKKIPKWVKGENFYSVT